MTKTLKRITYRELADRVGNLVLNNSVIEFAYKNSLRVEYENGSLTNYFDADGNEITEDEYSRLDDAYESDVEIYQYYVISDSGAEYLKENTDEIVIYIDELDIYLWGITHFGTAWDGVECDVWQYSFD